MTVIQIVRLIATEFATITDATLNNWITLFSPFVSEKVFGDKYNLALALYVCHKLKMAGEGESVLGELGSLKNGFGVGSVSDGGTSISFATGGAQNLTTDAEFTMTVYGQQFLQVRKGVVIPIRISGEQIQ